MLEDKPGPAFVCPLLYLILILKRKQNKASGHEQRGSSGCFLLRHQSKRFVPNKTSLFVTNIRISKTTIVLLIQEELLWFYYVGFFFQFLPNFLGFTQCNVNHAQQAVNLNWIFILKRIYVNLSETSRFLFKVKCCKICPSCRPEKKFG